MSGETEAAILERLEVLTAEIRAQRDEVRELREKVTPSRAGILPDTFSCAELAKRVGRSVEWVQDQCRLRRIKTVAGKRPYRIPASELVRMMEVRR